MYQGDLELFEMVPLCREFIDNNEDDYYALGYINAKIVNEFIRESDIESVFLNGYGYRQVEEFPFN